MNCVMYWHWQVIVFGMKASCASIIISRPTGLPCPYYLTYIEESAHCFSVLEPYKILLKTQNSSLTRFRWELFKSFWYHIKKLGKLVITKTVVSNSPDDRVLRKLAVYTAHPTIKILPALLLI